MTGVERRRGGCQRRHAGEHRDARHRARRLPKWVRPNGTAIERDEGKLLVGSEDLIVK